ncbi:MAG: hypothetical protein ACM3JJ_04115 [Hyphomicrobiales bacterium]
MRREGRIRALGTRVAGASMRALALVAALACLATVARVPRVAAASAAASEPPPAGGPATTVAAAADSPAAWLPPPIEDVDDPDRLEEEPLRPGIEVRASRREERLVVERASVVARRPRTSRVAEVAWLARDDAPPWLTLAWSRRSGRLRGVHVAAVAGALVVRDAPPLFATAIGWSRGARRPSAPVPASPGFEAPPARGSAALVGAGLSLASERRNVWVVGGRREADRARVAAVGAGARRGTLAGAIALGAVGGGNDEAADAAGGARPLASLTARSDANGRVVAAELMVERGARPQATFEAGGTRGAWWALARWRRRPGEARPVAAEWTAAVRGARASGRLTWRPWTSRAAGDDGAVEAEGTWRAPGFGPARLRLGARRGGEDPAAAAERYAVLDLTVASERGRSLALLASRRERRAAGTRGIGETLGGRITVAARGRAAGTLVVESARTRSAIGAAWTTGLTGSGESALVTRGRSSVAVSARGWVRIGAMRLRGLLRDASGGDGASGAPMAATLWLEWGE